MSRLTVNNLDKVAYSPWELCGIDTDCVRDCKDCPINEIYLKLAHYEDLADEGRLIELPCKVGSNVYGIGANGKIIAFTVDTIDYALNIASQIGKGFYLTKAEAEAKLAEMKEGEQ